MIDNFLRIFREQVLNQKQKLLIQEMIEFFRQKDGSNTAERKITED